MMARIRTLIWYTLLFLVLCVAYYLTKNYALAVVNEKYKYMEPTIKPRDLRVLRRSRATVEKLRRDDLIAYRAVYRSKEQRMFGRVLAVPGHVLTYRGGRLYANETDVGALPAPLGNLIGTDGLIVPRDTVFVSFDSSKADHVSISQRLIPLNNIVGRVVRQ